MIRLGVYTSNLSLVRSCRVALDHLYPGLYDLQHMQAEGCGEFDGYIWDSESHAQLPPGVVDTKATFKLVIVSKASLSKIKAELPDNTFVFLQSPVSPASLSIALEFIVAENRSGPASDEMNSPAAVAADRNRILQKLLETSLRLQEHDRGRANFFSRAGNDLRVPLRAAQGYCGVLLAGDAGPMAPDQAQILGRIQRNLARLEVLITAVVTLSSSGPGMYRLNPEPNDLGACFAAALQEVSPLAKQKSIVVKQDLAPPSGVVPFDPEPMRQVLVTLLENSCRNAPRNGVIELRGSSLGPQETRLQAAPELPGYRIDIRDNGPAIERAHLGHLFDESAPFEGFSRSGNGLGLAICRMIVTAHGGRIWAGSDGLGTTFSVLLPYETSFVNRAPDSPARSANV